MPATMARGSWTRRVKHIHDAYSIIVCDHSLRSMKGCWLFPEWGLPALELPGGWTGSSDPCWQATCM